MSVAVELWQVDLLNPRHCAALKELADRVAEDEDARDPEQDPHAPYRAQALRGIAHGFWTLERDLQPLPGGVEGPGVLPPSGG